MVDKMDININTLLLKQMISDEINRKDFIFNDADYEVLQHMLGEINQLDYSIHHLAEITASNKPGIGRIVEKHIHRFRSEATRSYLLGQLVYNKVEACDRLLLNLYLHFKHSNEYIAEPGMPAPAHIYVRYDNAFTRLKPRKIATELLELVSNPRDAFYLPFTVRMLASWKLPELESLLLSFLECSKLEARDFDYQEGSYPSLEFMRRELVFTAIAGLKHYPSRKNYELIVEYADNCDNKNVIMAATKAMNDIKKHL